jgi:hypothetical protein
MAAQKKNDLNEKLFNEGKIDERRIFTIVTAKRLPGGGYGMVGLGFNKDKLVVIDVISVKLSSIELGETLFEIPIKEMENIKGSYFVFYPFLKFTWQGGRFFFSAIGYNSGILEAIRQ